MAKMGRPTKDPRLKKIGFKISQRELDMLQYCAQKLGKTRSNVIIDEVEKRYKQLKKQEKIKEGQ